MKSYLWLVNLSVRISMGKHFRIHYFQHVPFEGLGCIEEWTVQNGHQLSVTRFFEDGKLPSLSDIDWLIIMGGPMEIYDDKVYPWLPAEKQFIKDAIARNKVVLGICLGAQLLADALGAKVKAGKHKEIGWFPIRKTEAGKKSALFDVVPGQATVFHWHGDQFDIPGGCFRLAESEACQNQALQFNDRVLGLQFHFEATEASIRGMIKNIPEELTENGPFIQSEKTIINGFPNCRPNNQIMFSVLDQLGKIS
jgi:GMP synthase-like glutamine amidotransferase